MKWHDYSGNVKLYKFHNAKYVIVQTKSYYTNSNGYTKYLSTQISRYKVGDLPKHLRSGRGYFAYVDNKVKKLNYVGENPSGNITQNRRPVYNIWEKQLEASFDSDLKAALKKLDKSGLRPGQDELRKSRIKEILYDYNSLKRESSVYTDKTERYLVEGHHTTVATTILDKGSGFNMNQRSSDPPLTKSVYWTKSWYEFWKEAIKVVK